MKSVKLFVAGALAMGLWSCSSEEPNPVPVPSDSTKGDVFATITLSLPQGRSETIEPGDDPSASTNGNEEGKDYENNVDAIYVVLAESADAGKTFSYVAKSYSSSVMNQAAGKATFTIQFQSSELESFAGDITDGSTKDAYVFTYCNPTGELKTYLDELTAGSFVDATYSFSDGNNLPFATKNNFLMTNAELVTSPIPSHATLIKNNNTVATAYNLGTVRVQRVAARFDFEEKPASGNIEANSYEIKDNATGLPVAYVQIDGMSLINEAKEFYYLHRTAEAEDNGGWSTEVTLLGKEYGATTADNYIVSPNYAAKMAFAANNNSDYSAIKDNYFFNIGQKPNTYEYTMPGSEADNDDWINAAGTNYHIWRYASENTMPRVAQKHGITTGVIFRAAIKPYTPTTEELANVDGTHPAVTLAAALKSGKTIYAYTQTEAGKDMQVNTMLGTAKDVYAYAYTHLQSDIRANFVKGVVAGAFTVKINGSAVNTEETIFPALSGDQENLSDLLETVEVTMFDANLTENDGQYDVASNYNFVAYAPDADGNYYNYYYYYNRHNDNGLVDEMGVMEFATVRNNIYKLRVSTVAGFGQPGDVTPDPDTDDENPEVYFQVSCEVIDWVVRVNDIPL